MLKTKLNLGTSGNPTVVTGITIGVWLTTALVFSSSYGFLAIASLKMKTKIYKSLSAFIVLPSIWILGEYGRSWLFSIIQWAPDATLGPHWNFGALGLAAITTPLAPISRIVGLYGLSAVVVVINLLMFYLLQKQFKSLLVLIPLFLLLNTGLWFKPSTGNNIRAVAVQVDAEQSVSNPQVINAINNSVNKNTSLVVLPEYAFKIDPNNQQQIKQVFSSVPLKKPGLIVYSTYNYINGNPADRKTDIIYSDKDGHILHTENKSFLIPGGEYLPWYSNAIATLIHQQQLKQQYQAVRYTAKSTRKESVYSKDNVTIGALSCSGILSPELYRDLANKSANILTNSASLQAFRNVHDFLVQDSQMAIFHAIANAKPFIQAARAGRSFIIDGDGKFLASTYNAQSQVVSANISPSSTKTPYTRVGDIILIPAFGVFLMLVFKSKKLRI